MTVKVAERVASFRMRQFISAALFAVVLWLGSSGAAHAERSVTLAWDRSQSSNVTGYYVYVLEENSTTPTRITVGNTNQMTLTTLKEGLRYSFTVTAYNNVGESPSSNEALFVVPVPLSLTTVNPTNGLRSIQFQGAPGRSYELQASSDLRTWTPIWQSGAIATYGGVTFEDPQSATEVVRFYRLLVR